VPPFQRKVKNSYIYIFLIKIFFMEYKRGETMLELGRISRMRKQLGLTQKQLAAMAGVSQSLIAKIESGKIDPAYSKVVEIIAALESEQNKGKKNAAQIMSPHIVCVSPSDPLTKAVSLMRSKDISQLPVLDSGKSVGSLSDRLIVELLSQHSLEPAAGRRKLKALKVGEVMQESFPVIPADSLVDIVADMLHHYRAVLVGRQGKLSGIITRADLFKAI